MASIEPKETRPRPLQTLQDLLPPVLAADEARESQANGAEEHASAGERRLIAGATPESADQPSRSGRQLTQKRNSGFGGDSADTSSTTAGNADTSSTTAGYVGKGNSKGGRMVARKHCSGRGRWRFFSGQPVSRGVGVGRARPSSQRRFRLLWWHSAAGHICHTSAPACTLFIKHQ